MSGVFLSYSRADRALAESIIRGLRAVGVLVWWDEDMHSTDWQQELERQIVELATIVVLWTPKSANSDTVKDEARLGLENSKLINVIVGMPKPPFPFDRVNALPLDGWNEREPNSAWTRLVQTIEEKVVAKGGASKGEFTGAVAKREEAARQRHQAVVRAQEALDEAQAREMETVDQAQVAATTFTRAEEQHVRVMEMRATHLIMSAAAQEYEAARAAKEDADRALRAAKAEVKGATRELALAKAALESPESAEPQRRPKSGAPPVSGKPAEADKAAPAAAAVVGPAVVTPVTPAVVTPPVVAPAAEPQKPAAVERPAPAAQPAPAPRAAPAASPAPATAKSGPPPKSGQMNLVLGAAAVVLSAGVGAGVILMMLPHKHPGATPAASTPATAGSTAAAGSADPKAAAVTAANRIAGKWAPQGLTCDTPIIIAIKNGGVSMNVAGTTSTAAIDPSPKPEVVNATAEDGGKYVYTLGQDNSLSMADPSHQTMKMTKCAG
jgi:hypothetical protein